MTLLILHKSSVVFALGVEWWTNSLPSHASSGLHVLCGSRKSLQPGYIRDTAGIWGTEPIVNLKYDSTLANNVVLLASSGGDLQHVVEDSQLSVMWLE